MGFIKSVGKIAGKVALGALDIAVSAVLDANKKASSTQKSVSNRNDEAVVKKFENSSGVEKIGYARELEKRGYLKQDGSKYKRTDKKLL